ncbi:hypothetical protein PACTADRAFT_35811 [Pachysolen tannophilus NRRL Y-2460]|uniref:Uncharacterized protein n=1 Tax=Pachysolen tannophilus NRRL Y-2460 TaxID=669874 RepID=A0A1E4TN71_PACTA|nr:hypothetical protein PACTADRAFT_35811 [Pachysolen tannophilus NRRL Y-2460]
MHPKVNLFALLAAAVAFAMAAFLQEPVVPATKVSKNSVTASGESRNEKSVSNNSTFDTPVPQTKENSEVTTTETETKGGFPIPLAILAIILAVLIGKYFL